MSTGKSFSDALILESVNPQYDERLFIEFPEKYNFTTCCVQKLFFCFDIQNNICTQHVVNLYFSWNSMNNLSSYCWLTDARMRASEKDLPVLQSFSRSLRSFKGGRWVKKWKFDYLIFRLFIFAFSYKIPVFYQNTTCIFAYICKCKQLF